MLHNPPSTEDSDDIDTMARYPIEMKTEKRYMPQMCGRQKHTSEHHSFRNSTRPDHEFAYEHARAKFEQHELDKRRRRRAKIQLQHCPSCHCMPESAIHLPGRTKYSDAVEDVLENYENYLLTNPINEMSRCLCSHATPNAYHQPRKGSASDHRHPRRNEHDHTLLPALENIGNSEAVDSVETGCGHMPSGKNSFKKGNHWRSCQVRTELLENFDRGRDTLAKSTQHARDHVLRSEPRISRQPTEQTSKLVLNSVSLGNVEDHREETVKRNPNALLSATVNTVRPSSTRKSDLQASLKCNTDDVSKFNALPINLDDGQKQTEGARFYKTRKPSTILRSSTCRPNDEFPIIREEIQGDTHCEIIVNDNDQGATIRKNVYAGGDLDLHASKNHILGLIDRALSNEFGTSIDHQGNMDPNRELTQQEICIEITRAMQGDCCQSLAEDLLSHRGPKADYIKQLQTLRWEHMKHIQEEFRKLCSLQMFLDNYSPQQSLPTVQQHLGAVEQRPEERQQQQHDEKQSP